MAMKIRIALFWVMTTCSLVGSYRLVKGTSILISYPEVGPKVVPKFRTTIMRI
jgi:hypothetical protein